MSDPTYGGKLTYVNNKWRLEVLVDFDETDLPPYIAVLDKIRYRLYEAPAHSMTELESPDGLMILVPTAETFSEDTYVVFVEGYQGWQNASTASVQYFIQAGLKSARQTADTLGEFSLRWLSADPNVQLDATSMTLCHKSGSLPDLERPVEAVPDENVVEVKGLFGMGYYALIQAPKRSV